jgi:hypothetical protein
MSRKPKSSVVVRSKNGRITSMELKGSAAMNFFRGAMQYEEERTKNMGQDAETDLEQYGNNEKQPATKADEATTKYLERAERDGAAAADKAEETKAGEGQS